MEICQNVWQLAQYFSTNEGNICRNYCGLEKNDHMGGGWSGCMLFQEHFEMKHPEIKSGIQINTTCSPEGGTPPSV